MTTNIYVCSIYFHGPEYDTPAEILVEAENTFAVHKQIAKEYSDCDYIIRDLDAYKAGTWAGVCYSTTSLIRQAGPVAGIKALTGL